MLRRRLFIFTKYGQEGKTAKLKLRMRTDLKQTIFLSPLLLCFARFNAKTLDDGMHLSAGIAGPLVVIKSVVHEQVGRQSFD